MQCFIIKEMVNNSWGKKLLNVGQTYKSSKATKPYVQTENLWRFDFRRKTLTLEEPKSNLCLSDLWILEAVYATARVSGEIECLCMRNLTYKLINEQHIFLFLLTEVRDGKWVPSSSYYSIVHMTLKFRVSCFHYKPHFSGFISWLS